MNAITPEAKARQKIDELLTAAEWEIQNMDQFNRNASLGVAVREFHFYAALRFVLWYPIMTLGYLLL